MDDKGKTTGENWGAIASELTEAKKVGAENVMLRMPTSDGKMIEISLIQALNQLFIDMGHFDRRVAKLEEGEEIEETKIVTV